jgi:hypothetical protein
VAGYRPSTTVDNEGQRDCKPPHNGGRVQAAIYPAVLCKQHGSNGRICNTDHFVAVRVDGDTAGLWQCNELRIAAQCGLRLCIAATAG